MGEKLGSQWEPPRTVHHAQEFRFPSARSKKPPKDLKQDVIRSCLQIPLETSENGLERAGLDVKEQVGSLYSILCFHLMVVSESDDTGLLSCSVTFITEFGTARNFSLIWYSSV